MAADNRHQLRQDLVEYCNRVPPKINDGSYNLAIQFKAEVVKYRKLAARPNASEGELQAAINRLHGYW